MSERDRLLNEMLSQGIQALKTINQILEIVKVKIEEEDNKDAR